MLMAYMVEFPRYRYQLLFLKTRRDASVARGGLSRLQVGHRLLYELQKKYALLLGEHRCELFLSGSPLVEIEERDLLHPPVVDAPQGPGARRRLRFPRFSFFGRPTRLPLGHRLLWNARRCRVRTSGTVQLGLIGLFTQL